MWTRGSSRERGASLVEFALVVPLLSMFLFGIVQFGLAYDMKQSVNSAAREGARMAAIPDEPTSTPPNPGITYTTIRARVDASFNSLQNAKVNDVTVVVVPANTPTATPLKTCEAQAGMPPDRCLPVTTPVSRSPCSGQVGQTVIVTVTKKHQITIPFFGVRNVDLKGRGEFRCEIDA